MRVCACARGGNIGWKHHGGDLEKFSHLGLTIWAGDVTLILIADDLATKNMWCEGLKALLAPPKPAAAPPVERPKEAWGVELKIRSFLKMALGKLEGAKTGLTDGDGDDWMELCTFVNGMSLNLKNNAAQASPFLRGLLMSGLADVWDLKNNRPGPGLKDGGVELVQKKLLALLVDAVPEPPAPLKTIAAPRSGAQHASNQIKPAGLRSMSLQAALDHMWKVLDKPNRVEWGDEGFTLDLQSKGRYERDTCPNPLVEWVNKNHKFWSSPVTTTFMSLLDNYEREVGRAETITAEERQEMAKFTAELMKTDVMQFLFHYLQMNGKDPRCKKLRKIHDLVSAPPDPMHGLRSFLCDCFLFL